MVHQMQNNVTALPYPIQTFIQAHYWMLWLYKIDPPHMSVGSWDFSTYLDPNFVSEKDKFLILKPRFELYI